MGKRTKKKKKRENQPIGNRKQKQYRSDSIIIK